MHFTPVGDHSEMKVNAFLHTGKHIVPIWKDSTQWTAVLFFFSSTVNELGSLIHA